MADFKEIFITEISASIGAIKSILDNLQTILNRLPDIQYHDNCKDKINELHTQLNKLNNELQQHNITSFIDRQLLEDIAQNLSIVSTLIKTYDVGALWKDQQDVQKFILDASSECNEADEVILGRNKEFDKVLYLLNEEKFSINDFKEIVKYIKRSNRFHEKFSGWKKAVIIAIGALLVLVYFFRDIGVIVKTLAPYIHPPLP